MSKGREILPLLVGRDGGWDEQDSIEVCRGPGFLRKDQVSPVDRIEGSAEDTDLHVKVLEITGAQGAEVESGEAVESAG